MKALSILGTSSNAGKSWVATAFCAWLKQQGVRVAPFKAQNMSNNAYATLEGGEIGIAQAVQAEACGLRPIAEMNPILLKPSGESTAQLVTLGKPGPHIGAKNYYHAVEDSWSIVQRTLDQWQSQCDVLVMEGAGSPVELNLMDRDIANLRPIRYLNGKWILVSNIEMGGVFAQIFGTLGLLPHADQPNGLGFIVNRFRGDPELFSDAKTHFEQTIELPYLGLLPLCEKLAIDDEDSMNTSVVSRSSNDPYIAWIRYPHVSITQDQHPWKNDQGIESRWIDNPREIANAAAIVLPGSKNTLADLRWVRKQGIDVAIHKQVAKGIPIVGICGGFQMLGEALADPQSREKDKGLSLLPIHTEFTNEKTIERRHTKFDTDEWRTFEIHTGKTIYSNNSNTLSLFECKQDDGTWVREGMRLGKIWGSYQHGLFESPAVRRAFVEAANCSQAAIDERNHQTLRQETYSKMAQFLEQHINLDPIRQYLGI